MPRKKCSFHSLLFDSGINHFLDLSCIRFQIWMALRRGGTQGIPCPVRLDRAKSEEKADAPKGLSKEAADFTASSGSTSNSRS